MNKNNFKQALSLIILIATCMAIISWQFFDYRQLRKNEEDYKKFQQEEFKRKQLEDIALLKTYLMGKFNQAERNDFALVPSELSINGNNMYLRKEALNAFQAMALSAEKEGIDLKIASATRNFDYQKNIWNNKWIGYTLVDGKNLSATEPISLNRFNKILEYSAVPGTSRHHWGTDIDINDANPAYFKKEKGIKVYEWLVKNGPSFGFCQPYNSKSAFRSTGYNEEKWHWSYLPLAKNFTKDYGILIENKDITGFMGDENVEKQNLINNYVLGINTDCL